MKLCLITSFVLHGDARDLNITEALSKNAAHEAISRIIVVTESDATSDRLKGAGCDQQKVEIKVVDSRPTIGALIEIGNQALNDKDVDGIAISNGDIYFDSNDDVLESLACASARPARVLCITRHDSVKVHRRSGPEPQLALYYDSSLPNFLSADTWVYADPLLPRREIDYFLGQMNCDSTLASDLSFSGYQLVNPCLDIVCVHTEEDVKNDEFYKEQNSLESSKEFFESHQLRTINFPFTSYGVPWARVDWINAGYQPDPVSMFPSKAIWLYVRDEMDHHALYLSATTADIVGTLNARDIIILLDPETNDEKVLLLEEVFKKNRNIIVINLTESDVYGLMSKLWNAENPHADSIAFVSGLDKLTPELMLAFENVFVTLGAQQMQLDLEALERVASNRFQNIYEHRYGQAFPTEHIAEPNERRCTLVTSVFRADQFLEGFFENMGSLNEYSDMDHMLMISTVGDSEIALILNHIRANDNCSVLWHKEDPGLYECWNLGIRCARTDYISNANVDDLRNPRHVEVLCDILDNDEEISVCASALYPFDKYQHPASKLEVGDVWYGDRGGRFSVWDLADIGVSDNGNTLTPNNMPHCMPVWRRSLHDQVGYFDEEKYGTYADWAFWLKATSMGCQGWLEPEPLGYYFVNLDSHNRRGSRLQEFHAAIEVDYLGLFESKSAKVSAASDVGNYCLTTERDSTISPYTQQASTKVYPRRMKIHGIDFSYGLHRNDFGKLISALYPLCSSEAEVTLYPFLERYFSWGAEPGEASSSSPSAIKEPWIGILHVPFDAPSWYQQRSLPEVIFETQLWKESLPYCKGIITLSKDLESDFRGFYPTVPTVALKHPTSFDDGKKFSLSAYLANPTLVQVGDWLRKLTAIHSIPGVEARKVMLLKEYTRDFLSEEISILGGAIDPSVEMVEAVSNDAYDELLSTSVVFVWLYATSANNVVLECISRGTPIIVNPLPAVVEYLGEDYPLYMEDLSEVSVLLKDHGAIEEASKHLSVISERRRSALLTYESFLNNFASSTLYGSL